MFHYNYCQSASLTSVQAGSCFFYYQSHWRLPFPSLWQARNLTGDTADVLLEYIQRNIPEGVSMSVEQTALERLPEFIDLPPEAKMFLETQEHKQTNEQSPKE